MRFYTEGLLSKWGFEDGDILNELLLDNGIEPKHSILVRAVRDKVLPLIQQKVVVFDIETSHNPIRARTVDGVEVDHYNDNDIALVPEYVDVPNDVILKLVFGQLDWDGIGELFQKIYDRLKDDDELSSILGYDFGHVFGKHQVIDDDGVVTGYMTPDGIKSHVGLIRYVVHFLAGKCKEHGNRE